MFITLSIMHFQWIFDDGGVSRKGIILGSLQVHSGISLGSLAVHVWDTCFGKSLDHCEITLGSLCVTLRSLWAHLGLTWDRGAINVPSSLRRGLCSWHTYFPRGRATHAISERNCSTQETPNREIGSGFVSCSCRACVRASGRGEAV